MDKEPCTIACDLKMKTVPALEILLGKSVKKRDVLKSANSDLQQKLDKAVGALKKIEAIAEQVTFNEIASDPCGVQDMVLKIEELAMEITK